MRFWWLAHKGRLCRELYELREAGIKYSVNQNALKEGIYELSLKYPMGDSILDLIVTFPDLYPYFRFEIYAPKLELPHHQNPFGKNLCLIGRSTHFWNTTDTVTSLLREQLAKTIQCGEATSKEDVVGKEQQQAEPITSYYSYFPSMILVDDAIQVPLNIQNGAFEIVTNELPSFQDRRYLRGILSSISSTNGFTQTCRGELARSFCGSKLRGLWINCEEPLPADGNLLLHKLLQKYPALWDTPPNRVEDGSLFIWGVTLSEEGHWREQGDRGWLFACLYTTRSSLDELRPKPPKPKERSRMQLSTRDRRKIRERRKMEKANKRRGRRK